MLFRVSSKLEEWIISLLLVSCVLLVFVEVVMRFVFNSGFLWMQEVTLLIAGWMVLFGASYGIKVGSHIGVDSVVKLLPIGGQRITSLISVALALTYAGLFIYGGWVYLTNPIAMTEMEDIPIPKWAAHSILVIGFVFFAVRLLQLGWRLIKGKTHTFVPSEEDRLMEEIKHLHSGPEHVGSERVGSEQVGSGQAGQEKNS